MIYEYFVLDRAVLKGVEPHQSGAFVINYKID